MAGVLPSGAWGGAHTGMLADVIEVVKLYFVNGLDCWGCRGGVRTRARDRVDDVGIQSNKDGFGSDEMREKVKRPTLKKNEGGAPAERGQKRGKSRPPAGMTSLGEWVTVADVGRWGYV